MQTQGVQESRQSLHHNKNRQCKCCWKKTIELVLWFELITSIEWIDWKISRHLPAHAAKIKYNVIPPVQSSLCNPFDNTIFHNTSDNSAIEKQDRNRKWAQFIDRFQTTVLKLIIFIDTYEHGPVTKPTNANRKLCEKLYSEHTQWYEWPDG